MKKHLLLLCCFISFFKSFAQPIINNANNYAAGMVFRFQNCTETGVSVGSVGSNQIWDYSNLQPIIGDTIIESILVPSATPYDSLYPTANLVEVFSDGRWVYLNKTANDNNTVGYVDDNNSITMVYSNSNLSIHRPMTATTNIVDSFAEHFKYNTYDLVGTGSTNIVSEGWGSLILPNGTYNNVLKVHIMQSQVDTIVQFQTISPSTWNTWLWYDTAHFTSLLRIDSMENQAFTSKTVTYLLNQGVNGVNDISANKHTITITPNPSCGQATIANLEEGRLIITNQQGQIISSMSISKGETLKIIHTENWSKGTYFISNISATNHTMQKLLVY